MQRFPASILAAMAVLLTGSEVFGQIQQVGHRQGQHGGHRQGQHGGTIGYQSCDWNQCDTGRGISRCWTDCCFNDTFLGRSWATTAYPDSGWTPPVRLPVNYDAAWYAAYHPQAFYGNPGGGFVANYPTVYQPTDTTQLGYYYHNVPTWQSRPGMIPSTPRPSDYHARMCLGGNAGRNSLQGGYAGGSHGGGSCLNFNGYAVHGPQYINGPQYMAPNGIQAVRPVASKKQGLLGGFRFASLTDMLD